MRTNPGYATAYENLGDVYAMLASQAYDKAVKLDRNNGSAPRKLEITRELFTIKAPATEAAAGAPPPIAPKPSKPGLRRFQ